MVTRKVAQTSIESYIDILPKIGERIVETLKILKDLHDASDQEMTSAGGYSDPNRIRPRRYEAVRKGLIEFNGKRKCRITGKNVMVWRITKKGLKVLEFKQRREDELKTKGY